MSITKDNNCKVLYDSEVDDQTGISVYIRLENHNKGMTFFKLHTCMKTKLGVLVFSLEHNKLYLRWRSSED